MKHVVKAISLTCDGCGQTFETLDGMVCYADDEDGKLVEETARNSDWKMMNGHHYCPSCWERDDDDIIRRSMDNDTPTYLFMTEYNQPEDLDDVDPHHLVHQHLTPSTPPTP